MVVGRRSEGCTVRNLTILFAGLLLAACDPPAPDGEAEERHHQPTISAEPGSQPPTPEPAAAPAESAPTPAEPDYSKMADDAWCPQAHSDTVKIVEAMRMTMKRAGNDKADSSDYEPPAKDRYLELCGKLPLDMQKCLVVGYAARNRDACQSTMEGLKADEKDAYTQLMGK